MAPVETHYYDLLGVGPDASDTDLKKGYRKQAMLYHPDKNKAADAEERFKDISKAYQILSDPNLRAVYDKHGQSMADKEGGGMKMEDAAGFFANVFGGERFNDYIGEISLMKEMTSMASTMMTDEEKADLEAEMGAEPPAGAFASRATPTVNSGSQATVNKDHINLDNDAKHAAPGLSRPKPATSQVSSVSVLAEPGTARDDSLLPEKKEAKTTSKKRGKITPEQREKLDALEKERKKAMEERCAILAAKLKERLRPFVECKNPGDKDDPETKVFEVKIRREAEDLKLESFGVELLQTIGTVYMMKASSFLKSKKFLGISGFWSRMKEKGSLAKDAWGVIGSALGVQQMMQEMERLQAKGEIGDDEQAAMEKDMTGKIMLASWRGTRFEVVNVLREAVDQVLKDKEVSDEVLYNRAKGLLFIGAIFKSTKPDENDEERRELERLVADAGRGKSHMHELQADARAAARAQAKLPTKSQVSTP